MVFSDDSINRCEAVEKAERLEMEIEARFFFQPLKVSTSYLSQLALYLSINLLLPSYLLRPACDFHWGEIFVVFVHNSGKHKFP